MQSGDILNSAGSLPTIKCWFLILLLINCDWCIYKTIDLINDLCYCMISRGFKFLQVLWSLTIDL